MKLEDQVCSLPLAKRLKELGVKQESLMYWRIECGGREPFLVIQHRLSIDRECSCSEVSAFTAAEMGKLLPSGIEWEGHIMTFESWTYGDPMKHAVKYRIVGNDESLHRAPVNAFSEENEADTRAKMLIYLIENGLLKEKGS